MGASAKIENVLELLTQPEHFAPQPPPLSSRAAPQSCELFFSFHGRLNAEYLSSMYQNQLQYRRFHEAWISFPSPKFSMLREKYARFGDRECLSVKSYGQTFWLRKLLHDIPHPLCAFLLWVQEKCEYTFPSLHFAHVDFSR